MTLDPQKIATLRTSWRAAEPKAGVLLQRFYEILFETAPHAAEMFGGTDMAVQREKLGAALGFVIREVENPGQLLPALHVLGRRHAEYGVQDSDYDLVGGALIAALSETLGEDFTATELDAWATAYQTVSSAMIAGGITELRQSA